MYMKVHSTTPQQYLAMVQFLEKHTNMVDTCPKNPIIAKRVSILWRILAKQLNSFQGAAKKPSSLWMKSWRKKKKLVTDAVKAENDDVLEAPLNQRILLLLKLCGEVTKEECDRVHVKSASDADSVKRIMSDFTEEENSVSFMNEDIKEHSPASASAPELHNNAHGKNSMSCGDLDTTVDSHKYIKIIQDMDCPQTEDQSENSPTFKGDIRSCKTEDEIKCPQVSSYSDLSDECSYITSVKANWKTEEQVRTLKNTVKALDRCARAMRAMARAIHSQTTIMSDALMAQSQTISEALKAQGEIIAKALANR